MRTAMSPESALLHEEPLSAAQLLAHDIRALRKARGLTLAEIGARLKRSIGWLSQVEPEVSSFFSSRTQSVQPALARW